MGERDLPGVLVSGLEGPYGICEDHVGDLQKHFNLIIMQGFLENKTQFSSYLWGGKLAIDQELLWSLPSLKIIASPGAGLDHLDLKLVANFSVKVANSPQVVSSPMADMGMALLLVAARRVVESPLLTCTLWVSGHALTTAPGTESVSTNWMDREVTGATLGIIGMGSIDYKIAQRAEAFEMKILKIEEEVVGATYCESLDNLLQRLDFVLLAMNLTPQTQGLIGWRELCGMKLTAILINIGSVYQDALMEALQNGVIKRAALHVMHPEPLPSTELPPGAPRSTPHAGSAMHRARWQTVDGPVDRVRASAHGLPGLPAPTGALLQRPCEGRLSAKT
ncbi:unnamed protein product [Nyctereutes procyonoides]|uniref:(raccoon dog) hypothetical protein n=1 Tax=Nyctereutes procyonoides TaxID=34880 RepID=A0A811YRI3_NYCPR|nr:unnamed protein product [Nyctereutes procyonoides]CAD7688329.1 unnamed protein product [Nyctereutes procyonoides]